MKLVCPAAIRFGANTICLAFKGKYDIHSDNISKYGKDRNSDYLQWSRISVTTIVGLDMSARIAATQASTRTKQTGDSREFSLPYTSILKRPCGVTTLHVHVHIGVEEKVTLE